METVDTDVAALERDLIVGIKDGLRGHGCEVPSDDVIRVRFQRLNGGVTTEEVARVTSEVLREHRRSTRCGRSR